MKNSILTNFNIDDYKFDVYEADEKFIVKSAEKNYEVIFENSNNVFDYINKNFTVNDRLLIDENVFNIYKDDLEIDFSYIKKIKAIESNKTLEGCTEVLDFLFETSFNKGGVFYSIGGGIIQDISAFVAATYKRGISWSYFPTTLLSMSDSCIGSKSSINYKYGKNQLGLFSAPDMIFMNVNFLRSLEDRELNSGLGEILKLHIIGGEFFIKKYQEMVNGGKISTFEDYEILILNSLNIKRCVIEVDEYDKSYRRALNYGHTIGHILEKISDFEIPHGQAISIGMIIVNNLCGSKENSLLNNLILDIIDDSCMKTLKKLDYDRLLDLLKNDKKVFGNKIILYSYMQLSHMKSSRIDIDSKLISDIIALLNI